MYSRNFLDGALPVRLPIVRYVYQDHGRNNEAHYLEMIEDQCH